MKLRLRSSLGGPTFNLHIASPSSLQALTNALASHLSVPASSIRLSLNKREEIQGHPETLLTDFGVRSGDLLFYLHGPDAVSHAPPTIPQFAGEEIGENLPSSHGMSSTTTTTTKDSPVGAAAGLDLSRVVTGMDDPVRDRRDLCAAAAIKRAAASASPSSLPAQAQVHLDTNVSAFTSGYPADKTKVGCENKRHIDDMDIVTDLETEAAGMEVPSVDGSSIGRYSVPVLLQRVLLEENVNIDSPHALVILGVHAVMLETGFVGFDPENGAILHENCLPVGWSVKLSLSLSYTVPEIGLIGRATTGRSVSLRFQTLGNSVVVYGTLIGERGSQIYRLCVETSKFLSHEKFYQSRSEGKLPKEAIEAGSMDVFGFWKLVKDGLSIRLLADLCEVEGLPVPTSLLILPTELKMRILESLPVLDLVRVGCTCSELRHLTANDELWREKFIEEYGCTEGCRPPCGRGWKDAFRQRWIERKRRQRTRSRRYQVFPSHVPRFVFPSGLASPHVGITGGDYDRLPVIGRGGIFGNSARGPFRGMGGRGSGTGCDFSGLWDE